ncbi:amino acid permease [Mycoplasma sp. E35C]|uniref:amino acid permease n=1 Tax=Mycoplasma sp. E35C TaxID=2801918 RepID=UPI001CA42C99|nr:amino acid permease [Mycoplasma sp. E35C]QZX49399.1 amino acid permease [Mycoplasma sp. E35C]
MAKVGIKLTDKKNKIGLFASLSIMIGSMIGVGIFVKNKGVFEQTAFNPNLVIAAWVLSSIITFLIALSYIEITTTGKSKFGFAGYCETVLGKKAGRFLKISQSHFYNGIIGVVLFIYAGELLLKSIDSNNSIGLLTDFNQTTPRASIAMSIGIGFVFFVLFFFMNWLSLTLSKGFQSLSVFIKFVPIIIITIIGIIAGANSYQGSLFNSYNSTITTNVKQPASIGNSITIILGILPSVLFSFDSFLSFTSVQDKMIKPKKYANILLSIGVITVAVAYLLITFAMIFLGNGDATKSISSNLLTKVFNVEQNQAENIANIFTIIFNIFLLVSVLGVANGFMIVAISNHQGLIESDLIFGSKMLKRWFNKKFANLSEQDKFYTQKSELPGMISYLFVFCLFGLIIMTISIALGNDRVADGVTNFPTLFFFILYALVPFVVFIRRVKVFIKDKDKRLTRAEQQELKQLKATNNLNEAQQARLKVLTDKNEAYLNLLRFSKEHQISKFFSFITPIASISFFIIFAYQGIYAFLIDPIIESVNNSSKTFDAWGAFINSTDTIGGVGLPYYMLPIIYFGLLIIFFFIPWINSYLQKKYPNI